MSMLMFECLHFTHRTKRSEKSEHTIIVIILITAGRQVAEQVHLSIIGHALVAMEFLIVSCVTFWPAAHLSHSTGETQWPVTTAHGATLSDAAVPLSKELLWLRHKKFMRPEIQTLNIFHMQSNKV